MRTDVLGYDAFAVQSVQGTKWKAV